MVSKSTCKIVISISIIIYIANLSTVERVEFSSETLEDADVSFQKAQKELLGSFAGKCLN